MPVKILMPALSPTMTEGKLATWNVNSGDKVAPGDVLAEIETDKATMEVEAVEEGTIARLLVSEGSENVPVNTAIAVLLEEGENESDLDSEQSDLDEGKGKETTGQKKVGPTPEPAPLALSEAIGPEITTEKKQELRLFASPLAKRMALQAGIELDTLKGSGPNGRIIKRDVEAHMRGGLPSVLVADKNIVVTPEHEIGQVNTNFDLQEHSIMRKTIAERLTASKQTVPHFYLRADCEIDKLLEFRSEFNAKAKGSYKLSINDMIIKAASVALNKIPSANASWSELGTKVFKSVDISVAVSVEGGLITPIIFDADTKGLEQISNEMRELVQKARDGKLSPEEYNGGTFSISNLGMYGVKSFDAIINPPQACILAVGAGKQRAVVKDGVLAIATVMNLTLSVDHRAVDGAIAAQYMECLCGLIEDPMTMLL